MILLHQLSCLYPPPKLRSSISSSLKPSSFNTIDLLSLKNSNIYSSSHITYWSSRDFNSLVAQMVKNLPSVQKTRVRSLRRQDPLEKEMATHSRLLAWRIAWTQEPGSYSPWGCKGVRHNWAIHTFSFRDFNGGKMTSGQYCSRFQLLCISRKGQAAPKGWLLMNTDPFHLQSQHSFSPSVGPNWW